MQSMSSLVSLENSLPNEGGGGGIERTKNYLPRASSYTLHHWGLGVQLSNSIIFTNVSRVLRPGGKIYERHSTFMGPISRGGEQERKQDVKVQSTR